MYATTLVHEMHVFHGVKCIVYCTVCIMCTRNPYDQLLSVVTVIHIF